MKSIRDLQNIMNFRPQEMNSSIRYMAKQNIDWDVFLPSKNKNLQRDFVWALQQKRELIWSILIGRNIPRMALIYTVNNVYQVIDGKQRLSTMIEFLNGKFTMDLDGEEYYFSQLPEDYQRFLSAYHFAYYIVHEMSVDKPFTDDDKISWFRFINFAGTPQDEEHMKQLSIKKQH